MIGAKGLPGLYPVGGGIETHVENLARHLVADGHHVTVYVRKYANPKQKKSYKGINLITLPSFKTKHFDTITHVFFASLHSLTEDVDIVHYHGIGPATLSWISRLFKRSAKTVVTFHSRDQYHEKWGSLAKLYLMFGEWAAVAFPHITIAVSHEIQILCKKLFPRAVVEYIPNGVELSDKKYKTDYVKKQGLKTGHYFLHLARLVAHKAQDDTIRAFKKVQTDDKLVIAGSAAFDDVAYMEHLEKLAQDDPRIIFTGHISGEPLFELINHCRAFVHPSRSEGLSVAILEAMANGKLVIMSDIPANLELIDHSGIAVPVGDIDKLAKAIQWALDDPKSAEERGERGREVIRRLFSWEAVVKRTEKIYQTQKYAGKTMVNYQKA
ncbi:MAG: glycosyltransferase family 4 protein [Patescibacteria group bacterium]